MKRPWWMGSVLVLLAAALGLASLLAAWSWTRHCLEEQPRAQLPWSAVLCSAPTGRTHEDFLGDVQYLPKVPDPLPLLDEDLPARLRGAFPRHSWVERV